MTSKTTTGSRISIGAPRSQTVGTEFETILRGASRPLNPAPENSMPDVKEVEQKAAQEIAAAKATLSGAIVKAKAYVTANKAKVAAGSAAVAAIVAFVAKHF